MTSAQGVPLTRRGAMRSVQPRTTLGAVGREVLMISVAALAYIGIRALTEGRTEVAARNGYELVRLERTFGVAWEGSLQSLIIGRDALVAICNWVYIYGHWPVIASAAVILFLTRRDRYRLLRNAVFVSGAIGFLFFALVPVAPPRLLDLGLVDTVAEQSAAYRTLQPPELTNQYAPMPSLHFGWNLLVGVVVFGATRRLLVRAFAVLMPAAMAFAVVATGNHFVLDVIVGTIVVLVGLAAAVTMQRPATPAGSQPASRERSPFPIAHGAAQALGSEAPVRHEGWSAQRVDRQPGQPVSTR